MAYSISTRMQVYNDQYHPYKGYKVLEHNIPTSAQKEFYEKNNFINTTNNARSTTSSYSKIRRMRKIKFEPFNSKIKESCRIALIQHFTTTNGQLSRKKTCLLKGETFTESKIKQHNIIQNGVIIDDIEILEDCVRCTSKSITYNFLFNFKQRETVVGAKVRIYKKLNEEIANLASKNLS